MGYACKVIDPKIPQPCSLPTMVYEATWASLGSSKAFSTQGMYTVVLLSLGDTYLPIIKWFVPDLWLQ